MPPGGLALSFSLVGLEPLIPLPSPAVLEAGQGSSPTSPTRQDESLSPVPEVLCAMRGLCSGRDDPLFSSLFI